MPLSLSVNRDDSILLLPNTKEHFIIVTLSQICSEDKVRLAITAPHKYSIFRNDLINEALLKSGFIPASYDPEMNCRAYKDRDGEKYSLPQILSILDLKGMQFRRPNNESEEF